MSETKPKKFFYGWYVAAVCFLLIGCCIPLFINTNGLFMVSVTGELGISRGDFMLLTTFFSLAGFIISPIAGKFLQKQNLRYTTTIAVAVAAVAYACYGFAQSAIWFYVCAFIVGAGFVFAANLNVSILMQRWFVKGRGTVMSTVFAGSGVGAMILSPVITQLIGTLGWRNTYFVLGAILFIVMVPLSLIIIRNNPADKGLVALGAEEGGAAGGKGRDITKIGFPLKTVKKTPEFWLYTIGFGLLVATTACTQQVPAYTVDLGYAAAQGALFMSIFAAVSIFGKILMGALFDRFGALVGMVVGVAGMAGCFVFLLFGNLSFAFLAAAAVCCGFGASLSQVFGSVMTPLLFGDKFFPEILGIIAAVRTLSNGLGGPAMGYAYDVAGNYAPVWIGCLVICAVAAVMMFIATPIAQSKLKALSDGKVNEDNKPIEQTSAN